MPTIEEKLERFNRIILGDATRSRDEVLGALRAEAEKQLEDSKARIDREDRELLEREVAKGAQENESRVSRANIESRKSLLAARNDIIASVLQDLAEKLRQFTRTPEYRAYLLDSAKAALEAVGAVEAVGADVGGGGNTEGNADAAHVTLTLAPNDYERFRADVQALAPTAVLERGDEAMIGGCMTANRARGVYADNSLQRKVELSTDELFRISGLRVSEV